MKNTLILTILFTVLLLNRLQAKQQVADTFNTDAFWQHIVLLHAHTPTGLQTTDTCIVVVTNRTMPPDSLRFMGVDKDNNILRYFFIYSHSGKWNALQTKNISEAISYMPHKNNDWVIYTEGMGKLFTTDVYRGMRLAETYHVNVIMMDYPSILTQHGALKNYKFAIRNARIAYKDLVPAIDSVKQLKEAHLLGTGHVVLFFHSMGNNIVSEMVKNGMLPLINNNVWADNLILNAPCVKQRHHTRWLNQINFARNIYVNYNPTDGTLKWAHIASFKKQLGEKVRKPVSAKATYINFSQIAGKNHSNFAPLIAHPPVNDRVIEQYSRMLHGDTLQVHNTAVYRPSSYRGIGWDMLAK